MAGPQALTVEAASPPSLLTVRTTTAHSQLAQEQEALETVRTPADRCPPAALALQAETTGLGPTATETAEDLEQLGPLGSAAPQARDRRVVQLVQMRAVRAGAIHLQREEVQTRLLPLAQMAIHPLPS